MTKKKNLKLSKQALRALDWWIVYCLESLKPSGNYYTMLMVLTMAELYQRKVYPKTGILAADADTRIKLTHTEELALALSFYHCDYYDAPEMFQPHLYFISCDLLKLRNDSTARLLPPEIATN